MEELSVREDDWSVQITAPQSHGFYLRATRPDQNASILVLSDFSLKQCDNELATAALQLIDERYFPSVFLTKLVIQNILPSYQDNSDQTALVKRHDRLVEIVKGYAKQTGLNVGNSFLEPRAGKFDTVVLLQ